MARLGIAGIAGAGLLAAAFGLGGARLDAQGQEALVARGGQLFADKGCYGCHTVGVTGTPIGPDLRTVGTRYGESTLARWLREPSAQEPTRHMPKLDLTEAEAGALAAYLASLRPRSRW
jgi:mono/diheme cytochrome c family protein